MGAQRRLHTLKALHEIANQGYPFVAGDTDFTEAPPKKVVKAKNWRPPGIICSKFHEVVTVPRGKVLVFL